LPFSSITSVVLMMACVAAIAEREPTEAKPGISNVESPCLCTICSRAMPSLSESMRPNTVACAWPVDCTLRPMTSLSPPGNAISAPSVGSAPACSSMQEMPMPRSFLRLCESRFLLLKLSYSDSAIALAQTPGKSPLS
jgi:hypothetical protein